MSDCKGQNRRLSLIIRLNEYAGDNGFSHSDYADTMKEAASEIAYQSVRIDELEAQLSTIRALLPDSLHPDSKDWAAGNLADRIEWLKIGYEGQQSLAGELLSQLDALAKQEPVATVIKKGADRTWVSRLRDFHDGNHSLYASPIPSEPGKVTVTTDDHGRCVAVTRTDDEGRILSVIWEAGEMEKPTAVVATVSNNVVAELVKAGLALQEEQGNVD